MLILQRYPTIAFSPAHSKPHIIVDTFIVPKVAQIMDDLENALNTYVVSIFMNELLLFSGLRFSIEIRTRFSVWYLLFAL